jgi:hypothetical protein
LPNGNGDSFIPFSRSVPQLARNDRDVHLASAPLTLSQYRHLEDIPKDWQEWHPSIRKARLLSESLLNSWNDALLFRTPILRLDVPVFDTVEDLRWKGPRPNFEELCHRMKSPDLVRRAESARSGAKLESGK